MQFKVINIISGNTIAVSPGWKITKPSNETFRGTDVMISGLPNNVQTKALALKSKLNYLLLGKNVEIKQAALLKDGNKYIINCRVFLNGVDIITYFPELKTPGYLGF